MIYFTLWHYIAAIILLLFLALSLLAVFKTVEKRAQSIVAGALVITFLGLSAITFSIMDKYLKKVEISKLQINKRNGKIYYSGYVQNVGKYQIGYVKLIAELVNRGDVNYYEPGTMFKPRNALGDLFTNEDTRIQQVSDDFIIAKDLLPGSTKYFNVYMSYPYYFTKTADKIVVKAH